jgi:hypothetical protein
MDLEIYSSVNLYPEQRYEIVKGVGLKDDERVIFYNVHTYPIQYSPAADILYISKNIDVDVKYQLPENPVNFDDVYELLIIGPEEFTSNVQPLVTHKNSINVPTIFVTCEDIFADSKYNGRDDAEDIKLFIKDTIDTEGLNWGVKYVLLVGGRVGQSLDWYVPERQSNNYDGSEILFSTDLYYADIWKLDGENLVFEDWDSNGNNVFAEYAGVGKKDIMDFYPDVYVGRLTCNKASEVDVIVNKIITYETTTYGQTWFKNAYMIAGDTFPAQDSYYEGEMETQITYDWLTSAGFTVDKIWTSLGTLTGRKVVRDAINSGAGFLHFAGHGNPAVWSTHPPKDKGTWITGFQTFLSDSDVLWLRNGDMQPVVVVGGCHNAQFNTTMGIILHDWKTCIKLKQNELKDAGESFWRIKGIFQGTDWYWNNKFYWYEWVPKDFSTAPLLKDGGGWIACIGNTGLGYGVPGAGATSRLGGWIEPRFFDAYVNQSKTRAGDAHNTAISDYISIIGRVNTNNIDRKTIEQWVLLGDPSLEMGGVPS